MIFDAKCKSFKIFIVTLGLIGATWIADCQAEQNPVLPASLTKQSRLQALLDDKAVVQFEAFKRDRKRNKERWDELTQFVGLQVTAANKRLVNLKLSDWWTERGLPNKKPIVHQHLSNQSIAISPATLLVKVAGNMSMVNWWHVSNQLTDVLESTQEEVIENSTRLHSQFQAGLLQLTKISLNLAAQGVADVATSSFVKRVLVADQGQMAAKRNLELESVNEASADAYWSYYSDCDYWGVDFDQTNE